MRRTFRSSPRTSIVALIAPMRRRVTRHSLRPVVDLMEARTLLSAFTVTTTADNGDNSNPVPGSLREAITQANANSSTAGSVIDFDIPTTDPGYNATTNSSTITLCSTLLLSESAGPEVIQGPGANLLTISGNLTYIDNNPVGIGVFQVDSGTTCTLSGLTFANGFATNGGGIDNGGTLTVTDSTITNNAASNSGGGINNSGTLTITDTAIANNRANSGGGIRNQGILTVTGSTIANNGAIGGAGIENSGTLTLTNSTIASNTTNAEGEGGGIDNFGTLTAINTTIAYNVAAGIYDEAGGTASLYNTIVALNTNEDPVNYIPV
jgi:CSLREA domain-containing protein